MTTATMIMMENLVLDSDSHRRCNELLINAAPLKMACGSYFIPKPNRYKPLGEDAHFVCEAERAIGVADGVGGWAKSGIDSGVYARQLMRGSAAAVRSSVAVKIDPMSVLAAGYASATARGSSTACVAVLDGHRLRVANVGDSGLWMFREGRCAYVSRVQQHSFNCPYQLGESEDSDRPSDADRMEVLVKAGDIVVLGTDGLLDNVYPEEVRELLKETEDVEAEQLAQRIAEMALKNSGDKKFRSPFQRNAEKSGCRGFVGGKVDDITVVVAVID